MNKFLIFSLMLFSGFFNVESYAGKVIKLHPQETKLLENKGLWALNATCTIQLANPKSGKVSVKVLKNKGSINGVHLTSGHGTLLNLKNNSSISISAEVGTTIQLINLSSDGVQALCAT